MKFTAEITPTGKIMPLYDSDYETFKKVKRNKEVMVDITQPRNIKFHRKFFALINMVFENQDIYTDINNLRYDLTMEAGFFNEHVDFNGEIKRTAQSISFSKMDEQSFSLLYGKFIDTVIRIMKWDSKMIEDNIESYL
jgi:hypothetical protein